MPSTSSTAVSCAARSNRITNVRVPMPARDSATSTRTPGPSGSSTRWVASSRVRSTRVAGPPAWHGRSVVVVDATSVT
jgi:hypothetical protein